MKPDVRLTLFKIIAVLFAVGGIVSTVTYNVFIFCRIYGLEFTWIPVAIILAIIIAWFAIIYIAAGK